MPDPFCIDWFGGASAQLEIFSPALDVPEAGYQLKYTPAFRSTIRPPLAKLRLGRNDLQHIDDQLNRVAKGTYAATRGPLPGAVPAPAPAETAKALLTAGQQLYLVVVPKYVQVDLRDKDALSLEIGVDEQLLSYPWELFHDGNEFFCLKHHMGRFVNGTTTVVRTQDAWPSNLDTVNVLIISVPNPMPQEGKEFELLQAATTETTAIIDAISNLPNVKPTLLVGEEAKYDNVFAELKSGKYHIVHFNGHALTDRLILQDRAMTPAHIVSFVGTRPPLLCFINACETAAAPEWIGKDTVFTLAQAFLEADSYLLGTRWKLNDQVAYAFANSFYKALLVEQKPVGQAVVESRLAARAAVPDDLGWAAYIYYGDPRLWIHRQKQPKRRARKGGAAARPRAKKPTG